MTQSVAFLLTIEKHGGEQQANPFASIVLHPYDNGPLDWMETHAFPPLDLCTRSVCCPLNVGTTPSIEIEYVGGGEPVAKQGAPLTWGSSSKSKSFRLDRMA